MAVLAVADEVITVVPLWQSSVAAADAACYRQQRTVMAVRCTRDIARNTHSVLYMAEGIHHGVVRWTDASATARRSAI